MFTFALIDNGSEIDNVQADTFATEAEAQAAGESALDGVCPRGSAHRRFYRVEVRTVTDSTPAAA